jgi:predicted nuclease of predicted toxin-antitoxin system
MPGENEGRMSDEPIALFIALYLDADVYLRLAELLRDEGFDVISAREVNHDSWGDAEQLAYAASTRRAILTHNRDDFILLAREYVEAGREHYGIIVSEQALIGEMQRRLLRLLDQVTAEEMKNTFRYLSDFADRE